MLMLRTIVKRDQLNKWKLGDVIAVPNDTIIQFVQEETQVLINSKPTYKYEYVYFALLHGQNWADPCYVALNKEDYTAFLSGNSSTFIGQYYRDL